MIYRKPDGSRGVQKGTVNQLRQDYGIDNSEAEDFAALIKDLEELYKNWIPAQKVATKKDVESFGNALRDVLHYLSNDELRARILHSPPSSMRRDLLELDIFQIQASGPNIQKSLKTALALNAKTASVSARNRGIARKAAKRIFAFWERKLGRQVINQNRGSERGLHFARDLINIFDDEIPLSVIRDVAQFKRGAATPGPEILYNSAI